jgi:hypothetical protein
MFIIINQYDPRPENEAKRMLANLERGKQKVTCDCGSVIARREMCKHIKSQKHKNWIEANPNNTFDYGAIVYLH